MHLVHDVSGGCLQSADNDWNAGQWEDAATTYAGALKEDPNVKVPAPLQTCAGCCRSGGLQALICVHAQVHQVNFGLKICEANKNLKKGAAAMEVRVAVHAGASSPRCTSGDSISLTHLARQRQGRDSYCRLQLN